MSFSGKFHVVAIQGLCHAIISEEEEEEGSDLDGMTTIIWYHCTSIQDIWNLNRKSVSNCTKKICMEFSVTAHT